jgi:hypothetical protein
MRRIKDPASQRSVSIGIGFRERETAFDFKSSLNEYVRYVDRMSTANEMSKNQADLEGEDEQVRRENNICFQQVFTFKRHSPHRIVYNLLTFCVG